MAPAEGAGAVAQRFKAHRLADASTDLHAVETWARLRDTPPRRRDESDEAYRERMIKHAKAVADRQPDGVATQVAAVALLALGAAAVGDLDELLAVQLPPLFERFPGGSLYYVTVSDTLLAHLAFARSQLAFQLTPNIPLGKEMEPPRTFEDLTLTERHQPRAGSQS